MQEVLETSFECKWIHCLLQIYVYVLVGDIVIAALVPSGVILGVVAFCYFLKPWNKINKCKKAERKLTERRPLIQSHKEPEKNNEQSWTKSRFWLV